MPRGPRPRLPIAQLQLSTGVWIEDGRQSAAPFCRRGGTLGDVLGP